MSLFGMIFILSLRWALCLPIVPFTESYPFEQENLFYAAKTGNFPLFKESLSYLQETTNPFAESKLFLPRIIYTALKEEQIAFLQEIFNHYYATSGENYVLRSFSYAFILISKLTNKSLTELFFLFIKIEQNSLYEKRNGSAFTEKIICHLIDQLNFEQNNNASLGHLSSAPLHPYTQAIEKIMNLSFFKKDLISVISFLNKYVSLSHYEELCCLCEEIDSNKSSKIVQILGLNFAKLTEMPFFPSQKDYMDLYILVLKKMDNKEIGSIILDQIEYFLHQNIKYLFQMKNDLLYNFFLRNYAKKEKAIMEDLIQKINFSLYQKRSSYFLIKKWGKKNSVNEEDFFLTKNATPFIPIPIDTKHDIEALHQAIAEKNTLKAFQIREAFFEKNPDQDLFFFSTSENENIFHTAAKYQAQDFFEKALRDIKKKDLFLRLNLQLAQNGFMPIDYIAHNDDLTFAQCLIKEDLLLKTKIDPLLFISEGRLKEWQRNPEKIITLLIDTLMNKLTNKINYKKNHNITDYIIKLDLLLELSPRKNPEWNKTILKNMSYIALFSGKKNFFSSLLQSKKKMTQEKMQKMFDEDELAQEMKIQETGIKEILTEFLLSHLQKVDSHFMQIMLVLMKNLEPKTLFVQIIENTLAQEKQLSKKTKNMALEEKPQNSALMDYEEHHIKDSSLQSFYRKKNIQRSLQILKEMLFDIKKEQEAVL
jgi:hypothetical protein